MRKNQSSLLSDGRWKVTIMMIIIILGKFVEHFLYTATVLTILHFLIYSSQ